MSYYTDDEVEQVSGDMVMAAEVLYRQAALEHDPDRAGGLRQVAGYLKWQAGGLVERHEAEGAL